MRSRNLPLTLVTLALFLSFQEQCRIQAQAVEAGQLATSSEGSSPYPPSSRLGRRHAADQEAVQRRSSARRSAKGALKQRQLMDDDSAPAVVVRPVRQSSSAASSSTEEDNENADVDLSRAVRAAASTASGSAARITRSIEISNGPRPGAPTSTSVSIPVSDTDVTQSSTSTSSSSSSSSSASSSSSSSSSSTESVESSSAPTSTSASSSLSMSSSHRSSESPSTVFSTTTMSSSSSSSTVTPTDSSAPITNVWQAYNKNSRYFPVAIVITVVVGIAILVALVAILQCIARAPRFRKDKDRPLLIPRDSTWSDSNMSATSNLQSDVASRRDSISSQAAAAKRTTWETFNAGSSPSRLNSNASSTNKRAFGSTSERDVTSGSSATWAKEDFLPHSGEEDAVSTPAGFSIVDVYPAALPKFRAPAPTNATPASNLGSPYPPFPARGSASSPSHNEQYQNILPVIRRVDPAIVHNGQQQQPMKERLSRGPSILFKPRPGPSEQQSGHRLSMSRNGLPSHVVLPPGIAERRRWERCST